MKYIKHQQTKAITVFLTIIFTAVYVHAQDITGQWNGLLSIQGINLRLVFYINQDGEGYKSRMVSLDQNNFEIAVGKTVFDGSNLSLTIPTIGISYEGELIADSIVGTFKQGTVVLPMILKRTPIEVKPVVRLQEPKQPYPYRSEDVTFENKRAGITLAGTLTLPKDGENFPAVVLITGSGPQNRDEEIMGHKPFFVLSDYLTRNGIAVLRYDDRGTAQSGGNYSTATLDDFVADAAAAIDYLKARKEINSKKIGVLGHSYGGTIAFVLASEKENNLAYIVSMAGAAIPGDSLLRLQRYSISKKMGVSDADMAKTELVLERIQNVVNKYSEDFISQNMNKIINEEILPDSLKGNDAVTRSFQQVLKQMMSPEMKSISNSNPAEALTKIQCPVLALNGEKDLQVSADVNLNRVKELVKSPVTIKKYPGLNHLFQHCTTGLPAEYGNIEETISPEVLSDIVEWIKQVVR